MAFDLSASTKSRSKQTNLQPSIILDIEGNSTLFGCVIIKKYIRVGDAGLLIGDSWQIGGFTEQENQEDLISLDGTTTQITQQILQDKGGTGSVSTMQIALIDPEELATKLITPGVDVADILGSTCRVWLSYAEGAFPEDYVVIFRGIVSAIQGASNIILTLSSPEILKNQDILFQIQNPLNGDIDDAATTIPLANPVGDLALPADDGNFRTYVQIDNEIIEYTGYDTGLNELTGCTRASLGTVADAHTNGTNATSFYRLQGVGPELALKVLMSGTNGPWVSNIPVKTMVTMPDLSEVPNGLYFEGPIVDKYGMTVGDLITISGATNGANNFSEAVISSIDSFLDGYLVVVLGESMVDELITSAAASFRSQYDVLGVGIGMGGDEVDVDEFVRIIDLFSSSFPAYDFYLKDTVSPARDFVDTEILFPCGAYSIPRKGKVSCGFTSPPVAIAEIPQLDSTQVMQPDKTTIQRSIGKYFYNAVVYQYDEVAIDNGSGNNFNAGRITVQSDSISRIPVGATPLNITSKGLRNNPETNIILDSNARRFMERYKFGAELIIITVQYGVGFSIEVGDIVIYGDEKLLLPDTKFGTRAFSPRLMEVINKSMNIKTGAVQLNLLDTNYLTDGRYGIFSPSSVLGSGSTTTVLRVTNSFGLDHALIEADKWQPYIGRKVIIHDDDWTFEYETVLRAISVGDPYSFGVDAVSMPPPAGSILDIREYQDDNKKDEILPKEVHCFFTPQIPVVTGVSGTVLTINSGDEVKILPNCTVIVHNDWVQISPEVQVLSVVGTTVTLKTTLGFTPDSTYFIDLVGFEDGGSAYRYL